MSYREKGHFLKSSGSSQIVVGALAGLVTLGVCLRLYGIFTDPWLDELWSLWILDRIGAAHEIVTKLRDSNNHILNTFVMYAAGRDAEWYVYRFPSFLAALLSIPLVAIFSRPHGRSAAGLATAFFAYSYMSILYGSEARGYALAGMFFLIYALVLERCPLSGKGLWLCWFCAVLGTLSHFTFLLYYPAFILLSFEKFRASERLAGMVRLHAVPLAVLGLLYVFHVRYLPVGSGSIYSNWDVLLNTLAVPFGAPIMSAHNMNAAMVTGVAAAFVFAMLLTEIFLLRRSGSGRFMFYLWIVFIVPALVFLLYSERIRVLYPRYFSITVMFELILAGSFLGRVSERAVGGKVVAFALTLLFVLGNTRYSLDFARYGRGQYGEAFRYMAANSAAGRVNIGGEHDFRDTLLINYFARKLAGGKTLHYVPEGHAPVPEWMIVQSEERALKPEPAVWRKAGGRYNLVSSFPHTGLSGFSVHVYRGSPPLQARSWERSKEFIGFEAATEEGSSK